MADDLNLDLSLDFEVPTITVTETTVARLGGERVGCGNILARDYALPNGDIQHGISITFIPASTEEEITVGIGSEFDVNESRYRVVAIHPRTSELHGTAVLQPIA